MTTPHRLHIVVRRALGIHWHTIRTWSVRVRECRIRAQLRMLVTWWWWSLGSGTLLACIWLTRWFSHVLIAWNVEWLLYPRSARNSLATGPIDANTHVPPTHALKQAAVCFIGFFSWDHPLVQGKIFKVEVHFNVLLLLIVFGNGPIVDIAADWTVSDVEIHGLPLPSHWDIELLPRSVGQAIFRGCGAF